MMSRTESSSRSARLQQGANSAEVIESALAKRVTSWQSLTSSSVKQETIRSVPQLRLQPDAETALAPEMTALSVDRILARR